MVSIVKDQGQATKVTMRPWASKAGGGREGTRPPATNLGGDVPSRFENEVTKIRCLFVLLGYFGGRLATLPTIRPPLKNPWRRPCI